MLSPREQEKVPIDENNSESESDSGVVAGTRWRIQKDRLALLLIKILDPRGLSLSGCI